MTFEEMKKIVVDTLNCDEDKVTMEASLTEDLEADSLDAVELNMALEDACGVSVPDEELAKLYGSEEFHPFYMSHGCLARVLAEQGRPAYMYMFDHDMPGDDVGSYHGSDLWFFFDALNRCWRPFAGKHYDLARQVCRYVVNFCATGDPNGADHDGAPLPRWDGYTEQAPMMMVFGDVPEQRRAPVEGELTRLRQEQFMGRLKK